MTLDEEDRPTTGASGGPAGSRHPRRVWLAAAGALAAKGLVGWPNPSRSQAAPADGGASTMIVRSSRPLDLETPVSQLDARLTPADRFFVRSHFGSPLVDGRPWPVQVAGLVAKPQKLLTTDFSKFQQVTIPAVLQCAGNGRANFAPRIPGLQWDRGAVGHAEWTGVRLADVLDAAGLLKTAAHVHFLGADGPPSPKTPLFLRSIPLEKALDPSTLLATGMNGGPLPALLGGPVRLVVPGWAGNHWMKWVRWVAASAEEAPGFYMQTGYRIPKVPVPPDVVLKPSDLVPVTVMNVKSLITCPAEGAAVAGELEVAGVAWTGVGHVTRVDVWNDRDRRWAEAEFLDPALPWAWRRWRLPLRGLADGPVVIRARATDSSGAVQPEITPWNKSGYLWNGIDSVTCRVS